MKRAQCGETSFGASLGRPYAEGVRLALRRIGAQTGILVEGVLGYHRVAQMH
jgi:hypothetical protein